MSWELLFQLGQQEVWRKAVAHLFGREPKDHYEFASWVRQHLTYGVAVGTCNLVGTYCTDDINLIPGIGLKENWPFGDFSPSRYAWDLRERKSINPFPVWGGQGLFEVEVPEDKIG